MAGTTEAFSRVKIDALLADAGWELTDGTSVLFEHALGDGSRADYVLCDRAGRPDGGGGGEARERRPDRRPGARAPLRGTARSSVRLPLERRRVWFLDRDADAHARPIATFYSQEDLERRVAARAVRRASPMSRLTGGSSTAATRSIASRPSRTR